MNNTIKGLLKTVKELKGNGCYVLQIKNLSAELILNGSFTLEVKTIEELENTMEYALKLDDTGRISNLINYVDTLKSRVDVYYKNGRRAFSIGLVGNHYR